MRAYKYHIYILIVLSFISGTAIAKNKIYLASNTASIAMLATSESSFDLQITLNMHDRFTDWDLGFFMLHVFLNQDKLPFTAQICKQKSCMPLFLDVVNYKPASSIASYLKPELSSGHISLFKPAKPFILEDGNIYVIRVKGLKGIPKNITAMPQSLFLVVNNYSNIVPLKVTEYLGHER